MCLYCSKPNKCSQTHYVLYCLANAFILSALLDCPTARKWNITLSVLL